MAFEINPANVLTDTIETGIPDGGTIVGGGQAPALQVWAIEGIDATVTGATIIVPAQTGFFIPVHIILELASIAGVGGTPPSVTVGNNGSTYNNLVTTAALSATAANTIVNLSLVSGYKALDISANAIRLNVTVAALVYDPYDINCYILGYIR